MYPYPPKKTLLLNARRSAVLALLITVILLVFTSLTVTYYATFQNEADSAFPVNADIEITDGLVQRDITELLEDRNIVRSSLYLYLYLRQHYPNDFIKAGTYRFERPLTTREVADALVEGTYRSPLLRFTLPEGFSTSELPFLLPKTITNTSSDALRQYEGYLFPDTYFVSTTTTLEEIIVMLRDTYDEKLSPLRERIRASGFSEAEVIILASIIEREAKDTQSKRMVSGILQNRLELGMPLQVDAVFDYLLDKESSELTEEDLAIDSPYNTYKYAGLPPAPIANPGLESIRAVLEPINTDYLYYLTGLDGNFYYARTFEQHVENKRRYLE